MINKKYIIYIFIFIVSLPEISFAQMAVLDTAALNQRAQKDAKDIVNFARQIAQTTATANNTAQSIKHLSQQYEAITGNLSLNSILEDSFNALLMNYENLNDPLPSQRVGGVLLDTRNAADVKKLLTEKVFSTKDDKRQGVYAPLMEKYHGDSSQAALQLSQVIISNAKEDIEKVKKAARIADSNDELKAAIDVTNNLLVQLLNNQNEVKQLLAQLVRSQVSKDFRGTTNKAKKLEKTNIEKIKDSTKNDSNDVFKIKDSDMPFKRRGTSTVEKFFNNRGR